MQEPYIYNNSTAGQPRNCKVNVGGQKNKPRTAIYSDKRMHVWFIDSLSHKDATVIVTKINNRTTLIASIYLDITLDVIQPWLENIMTYTYDKGYACLLAIDSNCHTQLIGTETNKRGEKLEDFISTHKLQIENQGKTPTFQTSRGKSSIDITLTSKLSVGIQE